MTVAVQPQVDEVAAISAALDQLLVAVIEHRPPPSSAQFRAVTAAEGAAHLLSRFDMTERQRAADWLLDNPVRQALWDAIHTLGERLHEIGGVTLMVDVCQSVSDMDPDQSGRRMSILDHRWDGVGQTKDSPGWLA